MKQKWQDYQQKALDYYRQLQDLRILALVGFVVIVLLISWSGVKTIDTNYGLQKQITELQQQNQLQQLTDANLQLANEYYDTAQYLEIAARENFGLAAPGETELIVPHSVALAHTTDPLPSADQTQAGKIKAKQPAYQRHFQAWMNFLLHRQN